MPPLLSTFLADSVPNMGLAVDLEGGEVEGGILRGGGREAARWRAGDGEVDGGGDKAVGGGPVRWDRGWRRRCGSWTRGAM